MEASSLSTVTPQPLSPPWVELPLEITMDILQRLGKIEILNCAQRVCTAWWKVCHDPAMWRVVDLKYDDGDNLKMPRVLDNICRIAVDRSQGQLLKVSIEYFGNEDKLNYIAERSSQLRHLRLVKFPEYFLKGMAAAAKNCPLLEELHIYFTLISKDDIEIIGHSCPLLKSFILHPDPFGLLRYLPSQDNDKALAIVRSMQFMPKLRHLALIDNNLTNEGVQAILDGSPHLQSLDLRAAVISILKGI